MPDLGVQSKQLDKFLLRGRRKCRRPPPKKRGWVHRGSHHVAFIIIHQLQQTQPNLVCVMRVDRREIAATCRRPAVFSARNIIYMYHTAFISTQQFGLQLPTSWPRFNYSNVCVCGLVNSIRAFLSWGVSVFFFFFFGAWSHQLTLNLSCVGRRTHQRQLLCCQMLAQTERC